MVRRSLVSVGDDDESVRNAMRRSASASGKIMVLVVAGRLNKRVAGELGIRPTGAR